MQLRKFIEAEGFYRIPLKRLATGHYLFSAKINGISGHFILDTGASTSCVGFTDSAHFLLVSEESIIKAAGAGAINMETMLSRGNKFDINEVERAYHFDATKFGLWLINPFESCFLSCSFMFFHCAYSRILLYICLISKLWFF